MAQVVAGRDFDDALKGAVIDLHDQKFAFRRATTIGPLAADHQPVAFHRQLQVLLPHSRQFDLNDQDRLGNINIRVRNPAGIAGTMMSHDSRLFLNVVKGRINFAHGNRLRNYRRVVTYASGLFFRRFASS